MKGADVNAAWPDCQVPHCHCPLMVSPIRAPWPTPAGHTGSVVAGRRRLVSNSAGRDSQECSRLHYSLNHATLHRLSMAVKYKALDYAVLLSHLISDQSDPSLGGARGVR